MSKELEALEKLFDAIVDEYDGCENMNEFQKDKNIIETALKALEIIKEKRVSVANFLDFFDNCDKGIYNFKNVDNISKEPLIEEEMKLLKEVLK